MKFVILGHLLKSDDLKNILPLGKYLPTNLIASLLPLLPDKKSFQILSHFYARDKAEGWLVGLALTPKQMMSLPKEKVRKKILEAVLFSQNELKADLLMLGALTSPLTSAGLWLAKNPKVKLKISNGNTFTAAISIQATERAIELAGLDISKIKMAIVGAAGAIAEPITKYFNQKGVRLILVERTDEKFNRLRPCLVRENYRLTCDISKIKEADIIVTATSHPTALIQPQFLKKNAIVIDVAEPPDVPSDIGKTRPDVISIDGGRVNWGDIDVGVDLSTGSRNIGFACMSEVILQALEEKKENSIGSVKMEHIQELRGWAKKWNFKLGEFTSFNKPILLERFKKARN